MKTLLAAAAILGFAGAASAYDGCSMEKKAPATSAETTVTPKPTAGS